MILHARITSQAVRKALFPKIPSVSGLSVQHPRALATARPERLSINGREVSIPTGLFIDGKFVSAKGGNVFATEDPATGKPLMSVSEGREEDVEIAVKSARQAFQTWKDTDPTHRAKLLNKLADLMEKNAEDLIAIECADTGKTPRQCSSLDLPGSIGTLRYYAGWADKVVGLTSFNIPGTFSYTRREPVGVCGQIIPWKYAALPFSNFLFSAYVNLKLPSSHVCLENCSCSGYRQHSCHQVC